MDDGSPLSDTETVTVTITGTGDAPVITGGPDTSSLTETNAGLSDSGTSRFTDLDLTDNVTAAWTRLWLPALVRAACLAV